MNDHRHVLVPAITAMYLPLLYFSVNRPFHTTGEILTTLVACLLLAAVIWLLLYVMLRNPVVTSLAAAVVVFMLLAFAHYFEILVTLGADGAEVHRYRYQAAYHVGIPIVAYIVLRVHRRWGRTLDVLLVIGAILLLFPTVSLVSSASHESGVAARHAAHTGDSSAILTQGASANRPNIVVLVLDGYAREDVLRQLYNHDNSEFLDALRQRGFSIPRRSRANYPHSMFSLSSMLNMTHLRDMEPKYGVVLDDWDIYYTLYLNAEYWNIMRSLGYGIASFNMSGIYPMKAGDIYLDSAVPFMLPVSNAFLKQTSFMFLEATLKRIGLRLSRDEVQVWREQILRVLQKTVVLADYPSPIVVFSHVICPHPGFVFAREGEQVVPFTALGGDGNYFHEHNRSDTSYYISAYRQQIDAFNDHILQTIDGILSSADSIGIILLSDHGPGAYYDIDDLVSTNHWERQSNFVAVLSPDGLDLELPDDVTLINLFTHIMRDWFNLALPVNDDKVYSLRRRTLELDPVADFVDITAQLDSMDAVHAQGADQRKQGEIHP